MARTLVLALIALAAVAGHIIWGDSIAWGN
jgi:hypothetical protein